ncbi:hypothetical protein FD723_30770 [Nostoc sp. C052]|uniref:hypothetical protein n=1 Tax=Nostoc sp. C052 TaxID=2576902 RepID=UPI0015C363D9|nr:hypothetical protein [Nostoc sp. C052]QLE44377.1 hypothetical protein FD723_30770 [Nostoc sp. C052]
MLKGIYLTLMVGPAVPVAVPQTVLDALTSIEVTTASGAASGFSLTFTLSNRSPLQTIFLLSGGAAIPLLRVVIVVTVNGRTEVLMDGVIQHTQIAPGKDSQHSTLTVMGKDLTEVMDYGLLSNPPGTPYPAMPAEARVALLIAKYAVFGIIPKVIPSVLIDVPIPTDLIPRQQGTDLEYIQSLAREIGYVFYLQPGPTPGVSFAYWGPEIKVGEPQPALNINMDLFTNVESLNFSFNGNGKVLPIVLVQNKETKFPIPIPIPDITPLNPPLGAITPLPNKLEFIEGPAKLSLVRAAAIGLARAAQSADAVTGTGSLDVSRYGHILRSRQLVGVRGAGTAFDGLYYVKSVTHSIKRGEYKQQFELSRNGLVSTVQQVAV